jgi:hypothetical protein
LGAATLVRMKGALWITVVVVGGLLGAGALVINKSKVTAPAVESSVMRAPEIVERAWALPVAASFNRQIIWQSNVSRCGPAALANAYRSLGEPANTENKVLAGTGRCWTGFCILGLTLNAWATPNGKGGFLRDRSEKNKRQHMEFLRQLDEGSQEYYDALHWFQQFPVWLAALPGRGSEKPSDVARQHTRLPKY